MQWRRTINAYKKTSLKLVLIFSVVMLLIYTYIAHANYDLLDPCDKIADYWGRVGSSPGENSFISDSESQYGNVPVGQYRIYVEPGAAAPGHIRKDWDFSDESWSMELSMKIISLLEISKPYQWWGSGFSINIWTGTKRHRVLLNKDRIDVALSIENGLFIDPEIMEGDKDFHRWKFVYSAKDMTLDIYKDDVKVARFNEVKGNEDTLLPRVAIVPNASTHTPDSGPIDIYIDEIAFKWGEDEEKDLDAMVYAPLKVEESDGKMKVFREEALNRERRIIFNNDGDDIWNIKSADPDQLINQRTALLKNTYVDTIFYSTVRGSFGVFSHHTKIGTIRTNEILIDNKIDPLQVMVDFARENGIEIFWSMRMNDTHDAWDPKLIPEFKKEHPEYLIGSAERRPPYGGWTAVDYGHPDIRDLAFRYFEEVCKNYDIDGIELDFFRHPVLFKHKPGFPVSQEELDLMTELMVRIREMTDEVGVEKGHPILIAIRVPDSVEYCKAIGIDLERWLAEDLVDLLIVSGYFRINPWEYSVSLAHKYRVKVYASLDESRIAGSEEKLGRNSIESYRARAMNAWDAGIDGIYMFNYFNQQGKVWKELGDPEILKKLDKVYFATIRGSGNTTYFPYYQFLNLPTLNPSAPKMLIPGKTEVIKFPIGDDMLLAKEEKSLSKLTLCLQVEGLEKLSEMIVKLNGVVLTEGSINKNWAEYTLKPEHVKRGYNELEVEGLRKTSAIKLSDMKVVVDYKESVWSFVVDLFKGN